VLVPDGYQAIDFRQRMAEQGGTLGVHVSTFGSLLREILEGSGKSVPLAPPALIQLLIRQAIQEVHQAGKLSHYAGIREKPGFVNALQSRFAELKRGLVYPETFVEYASNQAQPLQELAHIYTAYQAKLQQLGWADPEGLSWLAVEHLSEHPEWQPEWPLMVLDGFDSFTQPQLLVLSLLSEKATEIIITLPGTSEMSRSVHRRFADTLGKLKSLTNGVELDEDFEPRLTVPLALLEKHLGSGSNEPIDGENQISLLEARSPADEVREALRWLKALIKRKNVDLRQTAVIVPDPVRYLPHLRAVADEFGLPVHLSVGQVLADTPLFSALTSLLQLSPQDFPRRMLLDTLRSPYFDLEKFSLSPQDSDYLDVLSRRRQVVGGSAVWLESLAALEKIIQGEDLLEEDGQTPRLPTGTRAEELGESLAALFSRLSVPKESRTIRQWIAWLEDLLDDLKFIQTHKLESDQAAQDSFRQILRDLVLAEVIVKASCMKYRAFVELLHDNATRVEVAEPSWPTKPAILVLRTIEGRGIRHQAVAILGLSEGIFPRTQKADPFLDEETRAALGLDSAFDPYQHGLFYQAITRSDQYLLLTRPYLAPDGEPWAPSPYWEDVKCLLIEAPRKILPEASRDIADACSPQEALAWAMQTHRIPKPVKDDLLARAERVLHGREVLESRVAEDVEGEFNGVLKDVAGSLQWLVGENAIWSASRLESYTTCPHMFLTANLLRLETQEEPALGLDAAQLGTLLHRILERVYQETDDPSDLTALLESLETLAVEEFAQAPEREGFRPTPLWEQEQVELTDNLVKTVEALHEKSVGWLPVGYEAAFGIGDAPYLEIQFGDKVIRLRGLIDRVDRDQAGNLRIIDYKTGSGKLSPKDLENGMRLQLPLYALAARDALGMGEPKDGFYWAILAGKQSSLRLEKYGFKAAVEMALEYVRKAVVGVGEANFSPVPPPGGCPEYCPASGWCWQYAPGRRWI